MNRIPLFEDIMNESTKWDEILIHGAKFGVLRNVKDALENGANVNYKDKTLDRSAFVYAAAYGYTEIMEYLEEHGANITLEDGDGENALSMAAYRGQIAVLKEYYDKIKAHTLSDGNTILHRAVYGGNMDAVKFVISKDKNSLDTQNADGNTPLYYAVLNDDQKMIKYLLDNGADSTLTNKYGKTPLDVAQGLKKNKSIKLLGS